MISKRKKTQYLMMVGLMLSVMGLTLGFAAFSNTLTIKSSATVTPDSSTFKVVFSSDSDSLKTDEIEPVLCDMPNSEGGQCSDSVTITSFTATNAIINNEGNPTLTGRKVSFSYPDQWTEYYVSVRNEGEYDAYLKQVIFHNVEGKNSKIVCTAESGTTQSLVDEACGGITYSVEWVYEGYSWSETETITDNIKLAPGEGIQLLFPIGYSDGSAIADGAFKVELGDIELVWSTVPNE